MSSNSTIAIALIAGAALYVASRKVKIGIDSAIDPMQMVASPRQISMSPEVTIPEKAISDLDQQLILRDFNDDTGQLTSYKIDPYDLSLFEKLRVAANQFTITDDTLHTGFLARLQESSLAKAATFTQYLYPGRLIGSVGDKITSWF